MCVCVCLFVYVCVFVYVCLSNAVAVGALENKDVAFLVAQLGSDSHQSNNNNNSDGDDS